MENNYNLNLDELAQIKVQLEKLTKKKRDTNQKACEKENEKLKSSMQEMKIKSKQI
jgi:hypothetical protein